MYKQWRELTHKLFSLFKGGSCPAPWIERFGNCYHVINKINPISRDDASDACRKDSANLASITSEEEDSFLKSYKFYRMWIGGKKNGVWNWDDGSSFSYSNWYLNAESGYNGLCSYMHENSHWHDAKCDGTSLSISEFICKTTCKYIQRDK